MLTRSVAVLVLLGVQARRAGAQDPAAANLPGTPDPWRTITVKNNCPYTIWPAVFTTPSRNKVVPTDPTGWEAPSGSSKTIKVPNSWEAGRIWARTKCDFSNPNTAPPDLCKSGSCAGGLQCDRASGTGIGPQTLAEWTLAGAAVNIENNVQNPEDNYDVSLVDGFNIPMQIDTDKGCPAGSCTKNLLTDCPSGNKLSEDQCASDCQLVPEAQQKNSNICCTGEFSTPDKCTAANIPHYHFFKDNCERAYVFAYDEPSQKALWTCPGDKHTNYLVTFCP